MAQRLTRLDAVNIVLTNIGQSPVTTIDNDNPLISMAVNTLDEVAEAIQSEGWAFNSEIQYPFTPDVNNEILVPTNVIRVDAEPLDDVDLVIRMGKLYDRRAHTYKFEGTQYFNVLWLLDFEDMPQPAKQYSAIRAANLFAGRTVGSAEAVRFGEREEVAARAVLLEYETQQGDYSLLGTSINQKIPTYQPFNVIFRR